MKKLTAIICTIAMLLSFAANVSASDLAYYNYDMTAEFFVEPDATLDFLSLIPEDEFSDDYDYEHIVKELLTTKFTADVKMNMREDGLKASMYVEMHTNGPISFSEDFKITFDTKFRLWAKWDFTDEENAEFVWIYANPMTGKYTYADLNDKLLKDDVAEIKTAIFDALNKIDLKAGISEISALVKNLYEGNAKIEKTDDGYVAVSFTNDSFVEMAFDYVLGMLETDYMKNIYELTETELPEYDKAELEETKELVKSLSIFGDDDAYVQKIKLDENGCIAESESKVHVQCNLYDIVVALDGDVEEADEPLTKENSEVDVTFVSKVKFNSVGENIVIEMPELTEENSVNNVEVLFGLVPSDDYDDYVYIPANYWDNATAILEDGKIYASVERFASSAKYNSDNLIANATVDEDGNVVVIISTDYMAPVKIEGNVNVNGYKINGVEEEGSAFVTDEETGSVYMNVDVYSKVLECKVTSVTTTYADSFGTDYEVPETTVRFIRPNKGYSAEY